MSTCPPLSRSTLEVEAEPIPLRTGAGRGGTAAGPELHLTCVVPASRELGLDSEVQLLEVGSDRWSVCVTAGLPHTMGSHAGTTHAGGSQGRS